MLDVNSGNASWLFIYFFTLLLDVQESEHESSTWNIKHEKSARETGIVTYVLDFWLVSFNQEMYLPGNIARRRFSTKRKEKQPSWILVFLVSLPALQCVVRTLLSPFPFCWGSSLVRMNDGPDVFSVSVGFHAERILLRILSGFQENLSM